MAGGQAGFAGHLTVGDDVRVAARAGVISDVPAGTTVSGMPAVEIALWRRTASALLRLPELLRRVRRLETSVAQWRGDEAQASDVPKVRGRPQDPERTDG